MLSNEWLLPRRAPQDDKYYLSQSGTEIERYTSRSRLRHWELIYVYSLSAIENLFLTRVSSKWRIDFRLVNIRIREIGKIFKIDRGRVILFSNETPVRNLRFFETNDRLLSSNYLKSIPRHFLTRNLSRLNNNFRLVNIRDRESISNG